MSKRLRIAGGVGAVWDDASDADPFTTPLSNLSRVKFHSGLDYIKVIDEQTVTVNFSSYPSGTLTQGSYTMFAHGQSGIPLVFASALIGGNDVAFTGSIPVQFDASGYWARWVTIGADATNVYAYEYIRTPPGGAFFAMSALNLAITVWVTDEDLT